MAFILWHILPLNVLKKKKKLNVIHPCLKPVPNQGIFPLELEKVNLCSSLLEFSCNRGCAEKYQVVCAYYSLFYMGKMTACCYHESEGEGE